MSDNELLTLHGRLVAGELRVAPRIVELVLPRVVGIVTRDVGGLRDRQDAEEAVFDALLAYLERPDRYDPARAKLVTWLCAIAKRRASNIVRADGRRSAREAGAADIEQRAREEAGAIPLDERAMLDVEWERLDERWGEDLFKEPSDRMVFALMADGADAGEVAEALGLPPDPDGLDEAKRRIERLRGRMRRIRERTEA